jgi:hypothetical protein
MTVRKPGSFEDQETSEAGWVEPHRGARLIVPETLREAKPKAGSQSAASATGERESQGERDGKRTADGN